MEFKLESGKSMTKMEILFIINLAIKEWELFAEMAAEAMPLEEEHVLGTEESPNGCIRIGNIELEALGSMSLLRLESINSSKS